MRLNLNMPKVLISDLLSDLAKEVFEKNKVEVELPHKDILKLALLAHEKDVTLNVFINDVLKQGIKDGEHRFEHDKRPELLNEQNDHF